MAIDSRKSRPRVGRKRSEASREAILAAAITVLRRDGYAELSTNSIAEEARVGKQTIYRWWTSKADVVLEALAEHARTIPAPETGTLEGDLDEFLTRTFRLLRGPRGIGPILKGLMAEAQLDPEFAPRLDELLGTRREALRRVIGGHTTDVASIDPVVDMLFGALWYRLLVGHAPLDDAFARALARLAARAIQKRA